MTGMARRQTGFDRNTSQTVAGLQVKRVSLHWSIFPGAGIIEDYRGLSRFCEEHVSAKFRVQSAE